MGRKAKTVTLGVSQKQFLYDHLRGTGKTLTPKKAAKKYGIKQLPARMSELRLLGLQVRTKKEKNETSYAISARDIYGSRSKLAV